MINHTPKHAILSYRLQAFHTRRINLKSAIPGQYKPAGLPKASKDVHRQQPAHAYVLMRTQGLGDQARAQRMRSRAS